MRHIAASEATPRVVARTQMPASGMNRRKAGLDPKAWVTQYLAL